jgi:uncharacterized membrane protein YgcG
MRGSRLGPALLVLALLASPAAVTRADERVMAWESDIHVRPDSTLEVTETLRVRAEGDLIRRGIFRDFPTRYTDHRGARVVTGFDVQGVTRDGRAEPFRTEKRANGVRVWIGDKNVLLDPGEHSYTIRYRTDRQIGFFEDHDELYWNVTGSGWKLPIDEVTARVFLPGGVAAESIAVEAYTGPQGAKGRDWTAGLDAGIATWHTTRELGPGEGLTIVASWPKGHVRPPDAGRRAGYLLRDAWPALLAIGGLGLLLLYYLRAWSAVGRDPPGRIVVPRYEPPQGQSPASMRYLTRMGYDDQCFAAAILSLAVKGGLRIEQVKKGPFGRRSEYTLHRTEPKAAEAFSQDEWTLRDKLFASGPEVELDDQNHVVIGGAKDKHRAILKKSLTPSFFRINGGWHAGGLALSLVLAVAILLLSVTLGGFGPEWWFLTPGGWTVIGAALVALVVNAAFGKLLKASTIAGRAVMDHIAGYRLFLDVAEGDELKLVDAPPLTPALYERHLPAALALEVEQRWAERFATVFATQAAAQSPAWYSGDGWNSREIGGFTSSLGSSFESAISSAASAPGSSSGSGGGGSSGGGGGGGGGGGW